MAGVTGVALAGGILPVTVDQKTLNEKTAMMKIVAHDLASEDPGGELPPEADMAAAERLAGLVSPAAGRRRLGDPQAARVGAAGAIEQPDQKALGPARGPARA